MAEIVEKFDPRVTFTKGENAAVDRMLIRYTATVHKIKDVDPQADLVEIVIAARTLNSLKREFGGIRREVREHNEDYKLKKAKIAEIKQKFSSEKKLNKILLASMGAATELEREIEKNEGFENDQIVQDELSCYGAIEEILGEKSSI